MDGKDLLHIHSRRQKPQPDNELQCTHNMNWQGYLVTSTRKPWEMAGNWDSGKPRTGLPLGHRNGSEPGFHVSHLGSSGGDLFLVSSALWPFLFLRVENGAVVAGHLLGMHFRSSQTRLLNSRERDLDQLRLGPAPTLVPVNSDKSAKTVLGSYEGALTELLEAGRPSSSEI